MLNAKPLLPVSVRHAQKRSRRKGSCMRLVILAVVLFCVGYAVFATKYIGSSKSRREVQDNLRKAQLERIKAKISVSQHGAKHDGRSLKGDAHDPHFQTKAAIHKREELAQDGIVDDGSYDEVIAHDRARIAGTHHQTQPTQTTQEPRSDEVQAPALRTSGSTRHKAHHESGLDNLHIHSPHVAPVDHHVGSINSPVQAGPVEADRDAELRRDALVVAPSLAVGSRIEADSHAGDLAARAVVEPGGSPLTPQPQAAHELVSEHRSPLEAPIVVTHLEPDSHQAQHKPDTHEPVPSPGPRETDSSVQHHAPEDVPRAPDISVTASPISSSPLVPVPVTSPSPVVEPVTAPVTPPSPVPEPVTVTVTVTPPSPVVEPVTVTVTPPSPVPEPVTAPPHVNTTPQNKPLAHGLYALEAVDIDGKMRPLSEFVGKVTIVVNVASACGYTDENYKGLMKVYDKYKVHGLEIIGFPCNQFGSQESGTEHEIKNFCTGHYHVTFPMFSKVDVNGAHTHPVYEFLKRELPEHEGGGGGKGPGTDLVWNFQKIFVNHEGRPVKRLYQAWDQSAVESEVYRLLREAREAREAANVTAQSSS